jgi:hypothetical protein
MSSLRQFVEKALISWKLAQCVTPHLEVRWISARHQAEALVRMRITMASFVKASVIQREEVLKVLGYS